MTNKVELICDDCKQSFHISSTYWNQSKNQKDKIWRCRSCNSKYKSELNKNRWNNLTEQDRELISEKQSSTQKAYWNRLSKSERLIRLNNFIKGGKLFWDTISDADREIIRSKCKNFWKDLSFEQMQEHIRKSKSWYNDLSDDEKELYKEKLRKKWQMLPDEEKSRRNEIFRKNAMNYINSLTPDDRASRYDKGSNALRKFWLNITMDDRLMWSYLTAKGIADSIIMNDKKTSTEIEFINYLNIYKISYEYQYVNETFPSFFFDLYDENKSPFHRWDFILHLKNRDILVDVDGSEHTIPEGEFITKKGIDVGKNIKENDSKRPYQTDGMSSFIILAYDDIINMDTMVYSVDDDKFISFKDFIMYLDVMNMDDYKIKEIIEEGAIY